MKNTTQPTAIQNEPWNGREVESKITFKEKGTFSSLSKAEGWANNNGYSVGSSARTSPKGLMKGDYDIAKWYNLSEEDIAGLDGVMISNDFREGEVNILIFKK